MIPGLSENLIPKGKEKEGQKRLKSFCCMMDSMTDEELDTNKGLEPSRIPRIARGSGTTIKEVEELMVEHKRFAKMIGKMGKMGGKGGKGLDMAQMQRNPQAMLKNLQGAMDPRMLQQMGGQQGMMNMMKQMGNMDSTHNAAELCPARHTRVTVCAHLPSSLPLNTARGCATRMLTCHAPG